MVTTPDSLGVAHWGLARPSPEKAVFYWFCERFSRQLGETAERIPWQWMDALSHPRELSPTSRPFQSYPVPELSVRGEYELFVPFTGSVAFPMEL